MPGRACVVGESWVLELPVTCCARDLAPWCPSGDFAPTNINSNAKVVVLECSTCLQGAGLTLVRALPCCVHAFVCCMLCAVFCFWDK